MIMKDSDCLLKIVLMKVSIEVSFLNFLHGLIFNNGVEVGIIILDPGRYCTVARFETSRGNQHVRVARIGLVTQTIVAEAPYSC